MTEVLIFAIGLLAGSTAVYLYMRNTGNALLNQHFDNLLKNKLLREELKKSSKKPWKKNKKKFYHGRKKS